MGNRERVLCARYSSLATCAVDRVRFELTASCSFAALFLSFSKKENPPAAKRKKMGDLAMPNPPSSFLLNPGVPVLLRSTENRAPERCSVRSPFLDKKRERAVAKQAMLPLIYRPIEPTGAGPLGSIDIVSAVCLSKRLEVEVAETSNCAERRICRKLRQHTCH